MAKYYLIIPVAIGIIAAMFAVMYFGTNQKHDFTLQEIVEMGSPYEGNPDAPITIIEFGDYQCTFCYKFHQTNLNTIKEEYIKPGKASLVFVDFPLNGPDSVLAAEASHCANEQKKFWVFHDETYQNWKGERTGWVNRDSISQFASTVGLDVDNLNECIDSGKYHQKVSNTYEFGQKIGISGTPSFLIISGDKIVKITGNQPIDVFRKTLDEINA